MLTLSHPLLFSLFILPFFLPSSFFLLPWAILAPSWAPLGSILNHLGPILSHLGSILSHLGSILGPPWLPKISFWSPEAPFSPSEIHFPASVPSEIHFIEFFELIFAHFDPSGLILWAIFSASAPSEIHFCHICTERDPSWKKSPTGPSEIKFLLWFFLMRSFFAMRS